MSVKKIVTHPGTAHGDDFLACCILVALYDVAIERREPTQNDLINHETLVLDVGGQFDHTYLNFDHHHDLSIPCSAVLVLQWLGLHEKFQRAYRWYDNVDFRDRNGAQKLGEKYNLSAEQMAELGSPVHTALLKIFEGNGKPRTIFQDEPIYIIMEQIGRDLIDYAEKYGAAWERLDGCDQFYIRAHGVLINPSDDITATGDFMRERKIAVMCSHDNRGTGWAILRSNDVPEINLAPLATDPRIKFAHKSGFIIKTKELIAVDDLIELLKTVI